MNTNELTGAALDWAAAKCEGVEHLFSGHEVGRLHYSTDWAISGPIIEREGISVIPFDDRWEARCASSLTPARFMERRGPTPLIAAMRCYVASKLGDTVELPQDLIN